MKRLLPFYGLLVLFALSVIFTASIIPASQKWEKEPGGKEPVLKADSTAGNTTLADSIIALGLSFSGTPYYYTGKRPETGFDCSGFTHYIFGRFGIELSPASREQIFAGKQIALDNVKKGDLLVFTGTRVSVREPGHVGIVISNPGETPVRFVHSSSNGGVKVSEVQGTRYADRLLQARRLF